MDKYVVDRINTLAVSFIAYFVLFLGFIVTFLFTRSIPSLIIAGVMILFMLITNILFASKISKFNTWSHLIFSWIVVLPVFPLLYIISKFILVTMNKKGGE